MIDLREEIRTFSGTPALKTASTAAVGVLPQGNSFLLKLQVDFSKAQGESMLADLPGAFTLKRRFADPDSRADKGRQHYLAQPMPDGTVPVIEARIFLHDEAHPKWTDIEVGFAQSLISAEPHELAFYTDGVRLHILIDGHLMDENFIYGQVIWAKDAVLTLDPCIVKSAEFHTPCPAPQIAVERKVIPDSIQYFSTAGASSWVGDVVPFEHDGTVHLFYLHDRRHHGSKWGTGAHYYGHFSSTDLVNWTEHEFIGTIEDQNETCGTGTPFCHNGKYYFAYGLHTSRFVPWETTGAPLIHADWKATGKIHAIPFSKLGGRPPEGMTYAVSDDCEHFEKSRELTHFAENPSVYTMPDNSLRMYANGIWRADKVNGEWTPVSSDFPPNDKTAPMRNSLECPSFFEWNGHYYLIVGLCGCYSSATPDFDKYDDMALDGRDVYDGMVVPMVIPWKNNRRLICGWVAPFGTCFVWHELVQLPDHRLGIKWCPEFVPAAKSEKNLPTSGLIDAAPGEFCGYTLNIDGSEGGKVVFRMEQEDGKMVEFQLDLNEKWMQINEIEPGKDSGFCEPLPTTREIIARNRDKIGYFREMPWEEQAKCHFSSRDYRLDKLCGTGGRFEVRIALKFEKKYPATLIDVEVAGVRTMLSFQQYFKVSRISLMTAGGASVEKIVRQDF